jgi:hypothetical protein
MARKNNGADAPCNPLLQNPPTSWCNSAGNANAVTLSSTSFGSCVGLVLWNPATYRGAVAHFPGRFGHVQYQQRVQQDVAQILADIIPAPVAADWKTWIFGGESLGSSGADSGATTQTRALIDLVRNDVRAYLVGHLVEAHLEPETVLNSYVGHRGVTLTLANGTITWEEPRGASARTRGRTGSGSRAV